MGKKEKTATPTGKESKEGSAQHEEKFAAIKKVNAELRNLADNLVFKKCLEMPMVRVALDFWGNTGVDHSNVSQEAIRSCPGVQQVYPLLTDMGTACTAVPMKLPVNLLLKSKGELDDETIRACPALGADVADAWKASRTDEQKSKGKSKDKEAVDAGSPKNTKTGKAAANNKAAADGAAATPTAEEETERLRQIALAIYLAGDLKSLVAASPDGGVKIEDKKLLSPPKPPPPPVDNDAERLRQIALADMRLQQVAREDLARAEEEEAAQRAHAQAAKAAEERQAVQEAMARVKEAAERKAVEEEARRLERLAAEAQVCYGCHCCCMAALPRRPRAAATGGGGGMPFVAYYPPSHHASQSTGSPLPLAPRSCSASPRSDANWSWSGSSSPIASACTGRLR
jgi:hypothetical protein